MVNEDTPRSLCCLGGPVGVILIDGTRLQPVAILESGRK